MTRLLIILALAATPLAARAAQLPRLGAVDPHIQTVDYDPNQVVLLQGVMGRQIMLEFAPGELLENVAIGDSLGWQVIPSKRADLLFLKPLDPRAATNMTVVTNARRYVFELRAAIRGQAAVAPYVVRFVYPAPAMAVPAEPAPEKPPQVVNADYAVSGAAEIRPTRVFDDGRMVYLQWPVDASIPAIFAVAADNSESLVNYVVRGDYIVVEQLGPRFILRNGAQTVMIVDRGYAPRGAAGKPQ